MLKLNVKSGGVEENQENMKDKNGLHCALLFSCEVWKNVQKAEG